MSMDRDRILKMGMASVLCICGMVLLYVGLWMAPAGVIDSSVLVAYGEVMTFVGGLVGIDYIYSERRR